MFSILNLALTKYQILFTLGVQTDGSTKKLTKTIDLANEMKGQFASMGSKLADKPPHSNHIFHEYLKYPNPNETDI